MIPSELVVDMPFAESMRCLKDLDAERVIFKTDLASGMQQSFGCNVSVWRDPNSIVDFADCVSDVVDQWCQDRLRNPEVRVIDLRGRDSFERVEVESINDRIVVIPKH